MIMKNPKILISNTEGHTFTFNLLNIPITSKSTRTNKDTASHHPSANQGLANNCHSNFGEINRVKCFA